MTQKKAPVEITKCPMCSKEYDKARSKCPACKAPNIRFQTSKFVTFPIEIESALYERIRKEAINWDSLDEWIAYAIESHLTAHAKPIIKTHGK